MRALSWLTLALLLAGCATRARDGAPWRPRIVILMSIDTCRADHLGCYGYDRKTSPNLDRMARGGVLFENAFAQANESLFSYGSMLSGLYPQRIGLLDYDHFHISSQDANLASVLQSYGLRTAAFVAGGHLSRAFGFGYGFNVYQDQWDFGSFHSTFPAAMQWLDGLGASDHAFLMIQGYDVHAPYDNEILGEVFDRGYHGVADEIVQVAPASDNIYNGVYFRELPTESWFRRNPVGRRVMDPAAFSALAEFARTHTGRKLSPADVRHIVARYDAGIAYADVYVGLLLAHLYAHHLENDVLVVVMGDHGEDLMEHGYFNHRDAVTDSCVHVPLILWGPGGIPRGVRSRQVVQLLDILPTILDFEGCKPLGPADGHSLRECLTGTPAATARAYSEGILPMVTVRAMDARLVFHGHSTPGKAPAPTLSARSAQYYRIDRNGHERAAPLDDEATALWHDLIEWQRHMGRTLSSAATP